MIEMNGPSGNSDKIVSTLLVLMAFHGSPALVHYCSNEKRSGMLAGQLVADAAATAYLS